MRDAARRGKLKLAVVAPRRVAEQSGQGGPAADGAKRIRHGRGSARGRAGRRVSDGSRRRPSESSIDRFGERDSCSALSLDRRGMPRLGSSIEEDGLSKLRVHDMAGEFGISSDEVITLLRQMDVPVRSHLSLLTDDQVARIRARWEREKRARAKAAAPAPPRRRRRRRRSRAAAAAACSRAPLKPATPSPPRRRSQPAPVDAIADRRARGRSRRCRTRRSSTRAAKVAYAAEAAAAPSAAVERRSTRRSGHRVVERCRRSSRAPHSAQPSRPVRAPEPSAQPPQSAGASRSAAAGHARASSARARVVPGAPRPRPVATGAPFTPPRPVASAAPGAQALASPGARR